MNERLGLRAAGTVLVTMVALGACKRGGESEPPVHDEAEVAPYLDVQEASITSEPGGVVATRPVAIHLALGGTPSCDDAAAFEAGVLIDADADLATGATGEGFEGLGVDAKIAIRCVEGALGTDVGTLTVSTEEGGRVVLLVETTVEELPSPSFRWVAYAHDGVDRLVRLPAGSEVATWSIDEIGAY